MKVLIVSDTHGHEENFEKVLEKVGNIQHLIHLGDVEGHEDYIEAISGCPVHIVAGNNDFFSDLPREEELWLGGYKRILTKRTRTAHTRTLLWRFHGNQPP